MPPARPGEGARMKPAEPRYVVPGLERGLRILQLFDRKRRRLTGAEIARALTIPRSTAFRLALSHRPQRSTGSRLCGRNAA